MAVLLYIYRLLDLLLWFIPFKSLYHRFDYLLPFTHDHWYLPVPCLNTPHLSLLPKPVIVQFLDTLNSHAGTRQHPPKVYHSVA